MILKFIWIEDYGVINNQGFNFDPNVFYTFNKETGELSKEVIDAVPINFFNITNDTIDNISVLVGENGTGKSTVFQFISSFLTSYRPLGGFIITEKEIINKSDSVINYSKKWVGEKLPILNRLDLINRYRREQGLAEFDATQDTRNNILGLRILENLVEDTRIIYYSGEFNLGHTNRIFQSLLSMVNEYENSFYTDISDIALMSKDQDRYRSNKAIYSGENPVLTYRSGESQRFTDLMTSNYRSLIPFSLDNLTLRISFNDIDAAFFESYDEIAFKPIVKSINSISLNKRERFSKKTKAFLSEIENFGLRGYFETKLSRLEQKVSDYKLKNLLYHRLLLRHIREQIMQTMGELTYDNKLNFFITILLDIEKSFSSSKSYLDQIGDYFKTTQFAVQYTGTLNLKEIDAFHSKLVDLHLWRDEQFASDLSNLEIIDNLISAINSFELNSGVEYNISSIFDLDMRGLSTGEKQFLKIFSRFVFYDLSNKSNLTEVKHFIILLDEFDLGFHPRWQRKFLLTWIDFLEKFVNQTSDNKIHVQIILTSHSPFVASDLPKQCINFLSKKEGDKYSKVDNLNDHQATFGANIHELFSESFFLDGALMGDFAKSKIDSIINKLKNNKPVDDPKSIRSQIQLIGEPIIKVKLTEMLADNLGENIEVARLHAQQEYIIQRLKEIEANDPNRTNTTKKS